MKAVTPALAHERLSIGAHGHPRQHSSGQASTFQDLPPLKTGDRGGFVQTIYRQIPPDLPLSKGGTWSRNEDPFSQGRTPRNVP